MCEVLSLAHWERRKNKGTQNSELGRDCKERGKPRPQVCVLRSIYQHCVLGVTCRLLSGKPAACLDYRVRGIKLVLDFAPSFTDREEGVGVCSAYDEPGHGVCLFCCDLIFIFILTITPRNPRSIIPIKQKQNLEARVLQQLAQGHTTRLPNRPPLQGDTITAQPIAQLSYEVIPSVLPVFFF